MKERTASGLSIERPAVFDDLAIGSSVCVAGVCLTVIALDQETLQFDVVPATWSATALGMLQPGDRVNLERALKASGRFDGHVVQGHAEGTGVVEALHRDPASGVLLKLRVPDALLNAIVPKGSIALDGVSLTVAALEGSTVTVALVPHTVAQTTLGSLQPGDHVNIETDILMRMTRRFTSIA